MSGGTVDRPTELGIPLEGAITADAVEEALARSWQQVRLAQGDTQPIVRASVLSLIVCVVDPTATRRALQAIQHLSRQHPSRTIILLPDLKTGGPEINVWHATGFANGSDQERVVFGEQVSIAARGSAISYLPSLTDQLMLTDLPSFLWWVGDLSAARSELLDRLTSLADRLVTDSSDFRALGASMDQLYRLARRRHQPCAPSDLNWARLTLWRELIAQFFDSPAARPYLYHLDDVTVEYGTPGGAGPAQACLLVSWLARQLGWRLDESPSVQPGGGASDRLRRPDGGMVRASLRPMPGQAVDGVARVSLGAGRVARFLAVREDSSGHVLTEADVSGAPTLRRIARSEAPDLSSLLADEMMLFQRDHVYETSLRLAVDLSDGIRGTQR
ncbi:MAG: glucose-6-phosphate dehydrogenase assembly protein OpcA [Chloroflexota bacterium]